MASEGMQATRALRWYGGLTVLLFGVLPAVMLSMLVAQGSTPRTVLFLLAVGVPLVAAAVVYVVQGIRATDPEFASRRLHLGMALVAGADVVMLGGNALIRMAAS